MRTITATTALFLMIGCTPSTDSSASVNVVSTPSVSASQDEWTHEALGGQASPDVHASTSSVSNISYAGGAGSYTNLEEGELCWRRSSVTIPNPGSGWVETFRVQEPCSPKSEPAPLLVLFHKFGSSHLDTQVNTEFFEVAGDRRWYVVAPLSAATKHYGATPAQINTKVVIDYMLNNFSANIDPDRIYGVGFSMGGGAMVTYASRHVDPAGGMFAALLSHTGGGSLWHTYGNSFDDDDVDDNLKTGANLETPDILDFWFGGPPTSLPFEYQRHSVMDIDPFGAVNPGTSLITNLSHIPIHTWYAVSDPIGHLVTQTIQIALAFEDTYGGSSALTASPGSAHVWNTLDEVAVLDWLEQYTLTLPTSASTLADADGIWFHFDVVQDAAGAFTPFDWNIDTFTNTLTINNTANLQRIIVNTTGAGLDPGGDMTLNVGTTDGMGDEVRFLDIVSAPSLVLRDGVPDFNWVHDGPSQTLTITELDGGAHQFWVVSN
jgi:hypothetical protein